MSEQTRKHWSITGQQEEYFHVDGTEEYPTLLVMVAKWLVETNAAPDHIIIQSYYDAEVPYVSAIVSHSGKRTRDYEDPFDEEVEELDEDAFMDDMIVLLEKHGLVV